MDEKPVLEIKQSEVTRDATDIRPKRLLIFEDRVEFKDPSLFRTKTEDRSATSRSPRCRRSSAGFLRTSP